MQTDVDIGLYTKNPLNKKAGKNLTLMSQRNLLWNQIYTIKKKVIDTKKYQKIHLKSASYLATTKIAKKISLCNYPQQHYLDVME